MEIFVTVVIFLAYVVAMMWAFFQALERNRLFGRYSVLTFILVAVGLSIFVYAAARDKEKGPCLHYETQLYWNASVKAMMPARVCTQRAEWVEQ